LFQEAAPRRRFFIAPSRDCAPIALSRYLHRLLMEMLHENRPFGKMAPVTGSTAGIVDTIA
jgi:hypothetical protein